MLRVLCEWVLARSAPASPLARACALHLLCRDAGFLHDAGMVCWPGWVCCSALLAVAVRARVLCERGLASSAVRKARELVPTRSCA